MTESQGVRRKRALSFAGYTDLPKLSSGVPITQLPTISRSRRPSCICSGDYSATNEVFKDISNKLNNANSNADFSRLSEFRVSESPDLCSRKTSVATVVRGDSPCSCTSTPQMSPRRTNSYSDLLTLLRRPELSDYILPDGPLSSNLVKLYLAKLAASKPSDDICPVKSLQSISPKASTQTELHCLPECMQLRSPHLASMVMPVNQIIRAHANQNSFKHEQRKSSRETLNSLYANFSDRNALTDTSCSSGLSDAEPWSLSHAYNSIKSGYLSDNHLLEAASEAHRLNISKRQLELRLKNLPSGSNNMSSSDTQTNSRENLNGYPVHLNGKKPHKFEFTHVYDGLIPPSSSLKNNNMNKSHTNSLNTSQVNLSSNGDDNYNYYDDNNNMMMNSSAYYSVPNSPSIHHSKHFNMMNNGDKMVERNTYKSNFHDNNNNNKNSIDSIGGRSNSSRRKRFEGLRNFLLTTLKGDNIMMNKGGDDNYFYMDEKALERRIEHQAENVLSPVSF
ncbi:unnamed protein product [Trichobilharzia szidati]|nr:unnamed protein product [Trichobilharzia szidati]CAH8856980.1 unnamed protein product [Trichobilharzia szidati]